MARAPVELFHDLTALDFDQDHDEDPFYAKVYEPLARENLLQILPGVPCRILDAGGGTARWSLWLAGLGHHLVLTDISTGMLEVARNKIQAAGVSDRIHVLRADIACMPELVSNQFDLSMAQGDPVSYCANPANALAELARVTRPGGHVLVSVDSRMKAARAMAAQDWERAAQILSSGEMNSFNPQGLSFRLHAFTVSELMELFSQHGLRVMRVIGIPAFFHLLHPEVQQQLLKDDAMRGPYLEIEKRFAAEIGWAGAANHIQIIGMKEP
jgi:ubiquinone/menaquinone biosynthesis C-methylase UbiE